MGFYFLSRRYMKDIDAAMLHIAEVANVGA
jgi:hypothetical protein